METENKDVILYLDDELVNLDVFEASFSDCFHVLVASNFQAALDILKSNDVKVVVTDQRMPEISGVEFIQHTQPLNPNIVFIMLTAFPDNEVLLSSINKTKLFRFMVKPWQEFDMKQTIEAAIEVYNSKLEKQQLICDLQIARANAQESERLKSAFLANLSHEIRTPLNGILGFTSMFEKVSTDIEKLRMYHKVIKESGDRLITIIEDIVTMSELETTTICANTSQFNLSHFFESLHKQYLDTAKNKNIEFKIIGIEQNKELAVLADKGKLREIFSHLINNAIKFTNKGTVIIGFDDKEMPIFFVKDTGIGIPAEKQKVIFEKFRQEDEGVMSRDHGGNGLGLSIAKGLVEMQGGKIWLESEPDNGTIFYFTIPIEKNELVENRELST